MVGFCLRSMVSVVAANRNIFWFCTVLGASDQSFPILTQPFHSPVRSDTMVSCMENQSETTQPSGEYPR